MDRWNIRYHIGCTRRTINNCRFLVLRFIRVLDRLRLIYGCKAYRMVKVLAITLGTSTIPGRLGSKTLTFSYLCAQKIKNTLRDFNFVQIFSNNNKSLMRKYFVIYSYVLICRSNDGFVNIYREMPSNSLDFYFHLKVFMFFETFSILFVACIDFVGLIVRS